MKNPKSTHGFVGAALSSSIWHFWKPDGQTEWKVEKVIQVEPISFEKSPNPVPGLITGMIYLFTIVSHSGKINTNMVF